jgi:transposase
MQIYKQFKECRSIKGIAKDNNMSTPTAAKVIDLIDHTAFELPEVLAIDEFRGNAEGDKFQCILTDPKNHKIIEILPTRKHEDIYDYLSNFDSLEKVKYVVMDMTGGYKALMKRLFPEATIIVDKYHYVRQIGYPLERTRVEEQKRLSDKWRKYFKRSKYLLLKNPKALDMDDYTQLQNLFRISPKLKEAYDIKLEFEDVIASKDRKDAAWRLSKWILKVQNSNLEEFKKVAATYQRWGKEILNSFDHPYTNGFTEGCNNRIKVLKRVSFGMPRFKRFRRRILHIMLD